MTPLCTGLAILGLCLPVPAQSLKSLVDAGWRNEGGKEEWFSSRVFGSNAYRIGVLVKGDGNAVSSVLLMETNTDDQGSVTSPLNAFLSQACTLKKGRESCQVTGARFSRVQCTGGWLLFRQGAQVEQAKAFCTRLGPLVEDLQKK